MKKLMINEKLSIRRDGGYYNLTDLFRLTELSSTRRDPWAWARAENCTHSISRQGWILKSFWAEGPVLLQYAYYLSSTLYRDVRKALGLSSPVVDRNSHAEKMQVTLRTRPRLHVSSDRPMSRSEPDAFTQMMAMQSVIDSTPSSHRSHDSDYSHHCSSSSSSWSGDSGSSDSGSSGGCD